MNKTQLIRLVIVQATLSVISLMTASIAYGQKTDEFKKEAKLPEVQVVGAADQKYAVKRSSTSTKTETLLLDTPQAVTVVTKELIRDQAMQSIADVIRYVPGLVTAQGEGNRDTVVFRGNSSTSDFFVDGIRDDVQYYRDFYNIERVEALKGSNAMIFGRGGSGGIINRVTKQAQWTPIHEASLTMGSWQNRRATVDFNEAINPLIAFRISGMAENSNSYRQGVNLKRSGLNPTFSILAGDNTIITTSFEYFRDDRVADRGIPSYQGKPLLVSSETFFGNARMSPTWSKVDAFTMQIDHDMGNGVSLRNQTRYAQYDKFYQNIFSGAVIADGKSVALNAYNNATQRKNIFNQTDLTFDIQIGHTKNKILTGIELGTQTTDNLRNTGYFGGSASNATSIMVPLNNPYTDNVTFRPSATDASNHGVASVSAIYLQDQIELNSNWLAIVGLRRDRFAVDFTNNRKAENIKITDTPISPRFGLVYKPFKDFSLYISSSLAFMPRAGDQLSSLTATNKAFDPEKFTNREIGAKWDIESNLSLTAAAYELNRSNVAIADPSDSTKTVLIDGQKTKGLEFGVSGKINNEWSIMGGYAYQDAKITKTQSATVVAGATLAQVPTHSASLWNRYEINRHWALAAGMVYRGEIYPSTDNKVILPSFNRLDLAAFYTYDKRLQIQLNIQNANNKTYYASANSNNNITPGSPRAIQLSLRLQY